jgi:hypothetical protein
MEAAMSVNSGGAGCRSRAHNDDMAIYDTLPHEIRDKLKIAKDNLCSGCIRNQLRRDGFDFTATMLDFHRRRRAERRGREVVYVIEEELKP